MPVPDDFTIYRPAKAKECQPFKIRPKKLGNEEPSYEYEGPVSISWPGERYPLSGRALACLCYRGTQISITVRTERERARRSEKTPHVTIKPEDLIKRTRFATTYKPALPKKEFAIDQFFQSFDEVCSLLFDEIFRAGQRDGIVIVTGGTGIGKSQIARGLIHKYLKQLLEEPRRREPHFVTFENPIEKLFSVKPNHTSRIDYTPRQQGEDVRTVRQALMGDALRQTPSLVYVGETRSRDDWRTLFEFATTGHMVITTAHSGSLIEAMRKIMEALHVTTSDQRSSMSSKLLGLIHLKADKVKLDKSGREKTITVPALWRNVSGGANAFVSDGLAAVLPRSRTSYDQLPSCLGRLHFATGLCDALERRRKFAAGKLAAAARSAATRRAMLWDLQGV
jgi:type IV secretory pathway ATPase VirB11/archaellum biosynthesis ATPase